VQVTTDILMLDSITTLHSPHSNFLTSSYQQSDPQNPWSHVCESGHHQVSCAPQTYWPP